MLQFVTYIMYQPNVSQQIILLGLHLNSRIKGFFSTYKIENKVKNNIVNTNVDL